MLQPYLYFAGKAGNAENLKPVNHIYKSNQSNLLILGNDFI